MGKLKRILALILGSALMVTGAVGCGQGEVAKKQEKFDTFVAGFGKVCVTPNGPVHMGSHGDAKTRVTRERQEPSMHTDTKEAIWQVCASGVLQSVCVKLLKQEKSILL